MTARPQDCRSRGAGSGSTGRWRRVITLGVLVVLVGWSAPSALPGAAAAPRVPASIPVAAPTPRPSAAPLTGTAAATSRYLLNPVTPTRIADTRDGWGDAGVEPLQPGRVLRVGPARFGPVPVGAGAVVLNVTAAEPTEDGYLAVFPCGTTSPGSSNVNFVAGQGAAPNAVIVGVEPGTADVCITTYAPTDVVVDVNAWMPPERGFTAIEPARISDTRDGRGGVAVAPLEPGAVLAVPVTDDPAVGSVALNVTAANTTEQGYLSVFPCGTVPYASSLNYEADQAGVPGAVVSGVDDQGRVCITSHAPVDVIVDRFGTFARHSSFHGITPIRVGDTRDGTGGVALGKVVPGQVLEVQVTDLPGLPPQDETRGMSLTVTATEPDGDGYLTVFPCDQASPYASNVNYAHAELSSANAVVTGVSERGSVCVSSYAPVHVVVDATGWFDDTMAPSTWGGIYLPLATQQPLGAPAGQTIGGTSYPWPTDLITNCTVGDTSQPCGYMVTLLANSEPATPSSPLPGSPVGHGYFTVASEGDFQVMRDTLTGTGKGQGSEWFIANGCDGNAGCIMIIESVGQIGWTQCANDPRAKHCQVYGEGWPWAPNPTQSAPGSLFAQFGGSYTMSWVRGWCAWNEDGDDFCLPGINPPIDPPPPFVPTYSLVTNLAFKGLESDREVVYPGVGKGFEQLGCQLTPLGSFIDPPCAQRNSDWLSGALISNGGGPLTFVPTVTTALSTRNLTNGGTQNQMTLDGAVVTTSDAVPAGSGAWHIVTVDRSDLSVADLGTFTHDDAGWTAAATALAAPTENDLYAVTAIGATWATACATDCDAFNDFVAALAAVGADPAVVNQLSASDVSPADPTTPIPDDYTLLGWVAPSVWTGAQELRIPIEQSTFRSLRQGLDIPASGSNITALLQQDRRFFFGPVAFGPVQDMLFGLSDAVLQEAALWPFDPTTETDQSLLAAYCSIGAVVTANPQPPTPYPIVTSCGPGTDVADLRSTYTTLETDESSTMSTWYTNIKTLTYADFGTTTSFDESDFDQVALQLEDELADVVDVGNFNQTIISVYSGDTSAMSAVLQTATNTITGTGGTSGSETQIVLGGIAGVLGIGAAILGAVDGADEIALAGLAIGEELASFAQTVAGTDGANTVSFADLASTVLSQAATVQTQLDTVQALAFTAPNRLSATATLVQQFSQSLTLDDLEETVALGSMTEVYRAVMASSYKSAFFANVRTNAELTDPPQAGDITCQVPTGGNDCLARTPNHLYIYVAPSSLNGDADGTPTYDWGITELWSTWAGNCYFACYPPPDAIMEILLAPVCFNDPDCPNYDATNSDQTALPTSLGMWWWDVFGPGRTPVANWFDVCTNLLGGIGQGSTCPPEPP